MSVGELGRLSPRVRIEHEGAVLLVTLDAPRRLNALDATAQSALDAVWTWFFADDGCAVAILTGAGERAFCAGADMASLSGADDIAAAEPRSANGHFGLSHRLSLPKPIIAAVNGAALGGGLEMALCCDIIIASEGASFALPEPLMGGAALAGGVARLSRRVPATVAADMVLACRTLSAREAFRVGLVSEVVAPEMLLETARARAEEILRTAPLARRVTKAVLDAATRGASLAEMLALGDTLAPELMGSADVREGVRAFMEKRGPRWGGE